jgi:hypothetical protein
MYAARLLVLAALGALLVSACNGGDGAATPGTGAQATEGAGQAATATPAATGTPAGSAPAARQGPERGPDGLMGPLTEQEERIAGQLARRFPETDFSQRTIDLTELLDGGPGKDGGIPSIQEPKFIPQDEADEWLEPLEPVVAVEVEGEARAYPIQILMWHEVANDTLGGVPIVATFCPLCNTAIAFDRRVDGEERNFGVSGLLRFSDLVMYDLTNESLWQQITGEAIAGVDAGKQLEFLPAQIVSWEDFRRTFPDALVLSRDTGFSRDYGNNPYQGYDRADSSPIFPVPAVSGDTRLSVKERVLTVERDGDAVAFPFTVLQEHRVLEAEVGGEPVVALWQPGTTSALDDFRIAESADVGAAAAYSPVLDGERLEFEADADGNIVDKQTGSTWNVLGQAVEGELAGKRLQPVVSANHFWFSWAIFKPETRVIQGS